MQDIYKDLQLLEDEQEEQDKDLILDMLDSLTHIYVEDEDESREVPWYCMLNDVASDYGYTSKEMSDFAKDNGYIVFKISPIGSFEGGLAIADKDVNLDVVKENVRKSVVDDFEQEKDIPEVKITFEKNESLKEGIDVKHGDVKNAPFVVSCDGEKFAFDTKHNMEHFIDTNQYSFDKIKIVRCLDEDESLKEDAQELTVEYVKSLVDAIYNKLKGLPKPNQTTTGGEYYGSTQLFRTHGNQLRIVNEYTRPGGYYSGPAKTYKDCYCVEVGGAYKLDDYREELNALFNIFPGNYHRPIEVEGRGCELIHEYGSNFSTYGVHFYDVNESLKEETKGKIIKCPDEELERLEKELDEIGFKVVSTHPGWNDTEVHYQIITKEGNQTEESYNEYVDKFEEVLDRFEEETGAPCTFNMGLQYDGYISCGFDVRGIYYVPGEDRVPTKPTKLSFRNGKPADDYTKMQLKDIAKHMNADEDDILNAIPLDKHESLDEDYDERYLDGFNKNYKKELIKQYRDDDVWYVQVNGWDNKGNRYENPLNSTTTFDNAYKAFVDFDASNCSMSCFITLCCREKIEDPDEENGYYLSNKPVMKRYIYNGKEDIDEALKEKLNRGQKKLLDNLLKELNIPYEKDKVYSFGIVSNNDSGRHTSDEHEDSNYIELNKRFKDFPNSVDVKGYFEGDEEDSKIIYGVSEEDIKNIGLELLQDEVIYMTFDTSNDSFTANRWGNGIENNFDHYDLLAKSAGVNTTNISDNDNRSELSNGFKFQLKLYEDLEEDIENYSDEEIASDFMISLNYGFNEDKKVGEHAEQLSYIYKEEENFDCSVERILKALSKRFGKEVTSEETLGELLNVNEVNEDIEKHYKITIGKDDDKYQDSYVVKAKDEEEAWQIAKEHATRKGFKDYDVVEYKDEEVNEDIEKHDTLNPKLFENNELKDEVKGAIQNIAGTFIDELKEDGIDLTLKDIILVGSNVSYNYTKDSDLDIHLIVDSKALECPKELVDKLYGAYRAIFNKNYDITIKGIPAEIYVELDDMGSAKSNGVYSINNGWVKEPVQQDIPELDREAFDKEFDEWQDKYSQLLSKEDLTSEEVKQFINDLYMLRKEGIASEGEYSLNNLIFKEFRNLGQLDDLKELRKELKGKELSLEQLDNSSNEDYNDSMNNSELKESKMDYNKLNDLANDLYNYLKEKCEWSYEVYPEDDDTISVEVNNGDWKHDHLAVDHYTKEFLEKDGKYELVNTNTYVTDEDGSDTYSAIHSYQIKERDDSQVSPGEWDEWDENGEYRRPPENESLNEKDEDDSNYNANDDISVKGSFAEKCYLKAKEWLEKNIQDKDKFDDIYAEAALYGVEQFTDGMGNESLQNKIAHLLKSVVKESLEEDEDDLSDVENGTYTAYGHAAMMEIRDAKERNYYIEYEKHESAGDPRYTITIDKNRNYDGTPKKEIPNEKCYNCFIDEIGYIGQVKAKDETDAMNQMIKKWPNYQYNKYDGYAYVEPSRKCEENMNEELSKGEQLAQLVAQGMRGQSGPFGGEDAEVEGNKLTLESQGYPSIYRFNEDGSIDDVSFEDMSEDEITSIFSRDYGLDDDEAREYAQDLQTHYDSFEDLCSGYDSWFAYFEEENPRLYKQILELSRK